ncbi:hypothetical protein EXIGLDRAFT_633838, partial [Exidia glandulosa HHB12029]
MTAQAQSYAALIRELNAASKPTKDEVEISPSSSAAAPGAQTSNDLESRATDRLRATASDAPDRSSAQDDGDDLPPPATAEAPDPTVYPSKDLDTILDISPDVPPAIRERALDLFRKRVAAFGFDGRLGHLEANARVRTKEDAQPVSEPMHGASPEKRAVIKEQLAKWFELGVIEVSESPWAAPVVIVYRNGKARF